MGICSIHQPNFFPWIGYWIKLVSSDTFVLYDNCPLDEQGYSRRVKINPVKGNSYWSSLKLSTHRHGTPINKVSFTFESSQKRIFTAQLKSAYGSLPYYSEMYELLLEDILKLNGNQNLSDFNSNLIQKLAKHLSPQTSITKASSHLDYISGQIMLIKLCQQTNSNNYLSGNGASAYLDQSKFDKHKVKLSIVRFGEIAGKIFDKHEINQTVLGILAEIGLKELTIKLNECKGQVLTSIISK